MLSTEKSSGDITQGLVGSSVREADPAPVAAPIVAPREGRAWSVDDLPVGLLVLEGGRAVIANAWWSTLSGQTVEESVGEGWWEAVHPEDRDAVALAVQFCVDRTLLVNRQVAALGGCLRYSEGP